MEYTSSSVARFGSAHSAERADASRTMPEPGVRQRSTGVAYGVPLPAPRRRRHGPGGGDRGVSGWCWWCVCGAWSGFARGHASAKPGNAVPSCQRTAPRSRPPLGLALGANSPHARPLSPHRLRGLTAHRTQRLSRRRGVAGQLRVGAEGEEGKTKRKVKRHQLVNAREKTPQSTCTCDENDLPPPPVQMSRTSRRRSRFGTIHGRLGVWRGA